MPTISIMASASGSSASWVFGFALGRFAAFAFGALAAFACFAGASVGAVVDSGAFDFGVGRRAREPGRGGLPRLDVHARPRVEVGFERLLAGPLLLRHVDEVDPDAIPERRPAAHAVDEDVGRLEVLDDVRMARLPALEALEGARP